jgi:hypothetical protein
MNSSRQQGRTYVSGGLMAASWSMCCLLALAVVFPGLLVAFDHHGVERIPAHAHLSMASSPQEGHSHAYEHGHEHSETSLSAEDATRVIIRRESATMPATSGPSILAIPPTFNACALTCQPADMLLARGTLSDQWAFPPATPPPTSLASFV